MSHLRLSSRAVACAVIVMSLSEVLRGSLAGELIALPGIIFDMFVTVIIMSEADSYPSIRFAFPFNFILYSTCFYAVSWLYVWLKGSFTDDSINSEAVK